MITSTDTTSQELVSASRRVIGLVAQRREESRRAIRNSIACLKQSLTVIERQLEDGLQFNCRETNFGSLGSTLDQACRELATVDQIGDELQDMQSLAEEETLTA